MRMLTTATEISAEITRLLRVCSTCQVAVAWATTHCEAFDLLTDRPDKIGRMVVGTHFAQTEPAFIERFLTCPAVRFVLNPTGVFHPKLYLFEFTGGTWEAVIGSPNLTRGGLGENDEFAVLVSGTDPGGPQALADMHRAIKRYWRKARRLTPADLDSYRRAWRGRQKVREKLASRIDVPVSADALITYAASLGGIKVPTIGSRPGRSTKLFTVAVKENSLIFTPSSRSPGQQGFSISRERLGAFCELYEKNGRSKNTSKYLASGVSSYVLGLIDRYENL